MLSDYDGDPSALAKEVGPVDGPIPVLITRNLIPFPGVMTPILIGRQPSLKLLDYLRDHPDQTFAVFAQKDASVDYPIQEDLFEVGVYAKLVKEFEVPGSNNEHSAIVIASARCRLKSLDDANNFFTAETEMIPEVFPAEDDKEFAAAVEGLRQGVEIYVKMNDDIPNEAMVALQNISNHLSIVNFVASNIVSNIYDKIMLLEEDNMKLRLFKLLKVLNRETQFLHIKKNIQNKTRADIDEQQKEYFLHQQIKNIREELGDSGESEDKRELKKKAFLKPWPDEVSKLFAKELAKLDNINPQSPDYSVLLNYLQTLVSLPWGVYTKDRLDLKRAQRVLDRNHYGMEKVKERILEYMAVLRLRGDLKSPILCLYGPPGVGKTSLGKSVAEAMGRKYVRVSLGGLHDEAEVRGHRRTYIGAMPGRIIQAIKQAGTRNPVIVLDEVDKLGSDFRGDPSSALLEVLDPEQNHTFSDHYLNVPFDLSKVMFLCTANHLETIPAPLRDRMEVISLPGYTMQEKVEIAKRHLLPKKVTENGLREGDVIMDDTALTAVIRGYTREAGLRNLERELGSICRKLARQRAEGKKGSFTVDSAMVEKLLGAPRFIEDEKDKRLMPGMALGLAWTPAGGEVLTIECACMKGKGNLQLTGQLGDVMKESARIAMSYIRSRADSLGIDADFSDTQDIHIHVPAGAVPKDGPSAGVTLTSALISALSGRIVRADTCMTGEITLQGRVLPVGGIKEKILAGVARGLKHVIIPSQNVKDLEEVPKELLKKIKVHPAHTYDDVLALAFEPVKKTAARARKAAPATEKK